MGKESLTGQEGTFPDSICLEGNHKGDKPIFYSFIHVFTLFIVWVLLYLLKNQKKKKIEIVKMKHLQLFIDFFTSLVNLFKLDLGI